MNKQTKISGTRLRQKIKQKNNLKLKIHYLQFKTIKW